jgi:hypothetical protein
MTKGVKTLGAIFIALLIIAGATYYFSRKDNTVSTPSTVGINQNPDGTVLGEDTILITAKHSFSNGTHIIAGEVNVPTPCHSLDVTSSVSPGKPQQVQVLFKTTDGGGVCAQVISVRRFKLVFNAEENATISATLNGKPATLNLIPASPGEDLNNFDIYIKG